MAQITIHCQIENFPVSVQFEGDMSILPGALEKLRKLGATPIRHTPVASPEAPRHAEGENTPRCPIHNRAMKPGNKGGWYCSAKTQDGYCQERA